MDVVTPLIADGEPAVRRKPGQCALDGLIAKDKFCMTRHEQLTLSFSHYELYTARMRRKEPANSPTYPPYQSTDHGGVNEAPVARPSGGDGTSGRPAAMGPSLPEPPSVNSCNRTESRPATEARRGGVPCA
jgi:hypothetical protein